MVIFFSDGACNNGVFAIYEKTEEAIEQGVEYAKNCPEPSVEAFLQEVERN